VTNEDQLYKTGMGNWKHLAINLDSIFEAAEDWKARIAPIKKPWLVWNVDSSWCLLQQKLVSYAGWTPVVGFDPRVGVPELLPESVLVDFNKQLKLPIMLPHFPLEFAFLFTDKIAFWHSDLLVRKEKLTEISRTFDELKDGATCATYSGTPFRRLLRRFTNRKQQRYWELIGCTTRSASKSQFENGCGWWMNFVDHVNFRGEKSGHYWDHGAGIYYWERYCGGTVVPIWVKAVDEGHFSQTRVTEYQRLSPNNHRRNLFLDINHNFNLRTCAESMGLGEFVDNRDRSGQPDQKPF